MPFRFERGTSKIVGTSYRDLIVSYVSSDNRLVKAKRRHIGLYGLSDLAENRWSREDVSALCTSWQMLKPNSLATVVNYAGAAVSHFGLPPNLVISWSHVTYELRNSKLRVRESVLSVDPDSLFLSDRIGLPMPIGAIRAYSDRFGQRRGLLVAAAGWGVDISTQKNNDLTDESLITDAIRRNIAV